VVERVSQPPGIEVTVLRIRRHALAVIAAVASLALLAATPAAFAATKVVHDKAGDGSNGTGPGGPHKFGDIGQVTIRNGTHRVTLTMLNAPGGEYGDFYDFWIDTDPKTSGPDYGATVSMEVLHRSSVYHAAAFGDFGGKTTCGGLEAHRIKDGITLVFARRCVGKPSELRVSTHSSMEYESADWAPARHRYGAWVASGPAN
jgi:hypothetical protein